MCEKFFETLFNSFCRVVDGIPVPPELDLPALRERRAPKVGINGTEFNTMMLSSFFFFFNFVLF